MLRFNIHGVLAIIASAKLYRPKNPNLAYTFLQ